MTRKLFGTDGIRGTANLEPASRLRPQRSKFADHNSLIGLDEYQQGTTKTDRKRPGVEGLGFVMLGLFGEAGSLLSELKKKQRDEDSYIAYHDSVIEELGDVLWYFANAAQRVGLALSTIAERVPAKLGDWDYRGQATRRGFVDLQEPQIELTGPIASELVERRLLALAGKVGLLLDHYAAGALDTNGDAFAADIVELFRVILAAADAAAVSLNEAARRNIEKTFGRWPPERIWPQLYDEGFDPDEQLPRRIEMRFKEKQTDDGRTYVLQQCNGINIGDRLTDNRIPSDDYRFHDVFHLAYAAILGWSPVLRALFKVKRKSKPEIDENQDGARAILTEEGIATWIFNHGVRNHDFRTVTSLDFSLLKAVRELVKGCEVEDRPLWQWERAILEGFRIFREIKKPEHRGGTVTADLINHSIEFRPPQ
ncbi:MAG: nucleoside triphosphate pyrophosphohydrolase family protein [Dongiaceae bacterium]